MCIINFHYKDHPNYDLIILANRDEFYGRPTAAAHFWEEDQELLAGKDLEAKGTWLGITKTGRFAALTNIRDASVHKTFPTSRGALVTDFLQGQSSPKEYTKSLAEKGKAYSGFNILVGNKDKLYYLNNRENSAIEIEPGTHSVSNHFLNTPWPKVLRGQAKLRNYVHSVEEIDPEKLFQIGMDAELAKDEDLPETGVSIDLERQLSPLFIKTENYGTRSITILTIDREGAVHFIERTFVNGEFSSEEKFNFSL